MKNIPYRNFIVKSLYVLIGKFRFFQFYKLEFDKYLIASYFQTYYINFFLI